MRTIFVILVVGTIFSSCNTKENKEINDFSFYLPEPDLYITTSKRVGGKFYVMFSKTDSVSTLSDNVDYIECQTEDQILVIGFDPNYKNDIHFKYPYIKRIHRKNINLVEMTPDDFKQKFYNVGSGNAPDTLKSTLKQLFIAPQSYHISFQKDSFFDHQETLKKGDMFGR